LQEKEGCSVLELFLRFRAKLTDLKKSEEEEETDKG